MRIEGRIVVRVPQFIQTWALKFLTKAMARSHLRCDITQHGWTACFGAFFLCPRLRASLFLVHANVVANSLTILLVFFLSGIR
jgi:hypothetical protein